MGVLLNYPKFSASNDSGTALVGGELYTYIAGTSTNKATYSDYNLATANANPIVLDRRGEATVYGSGVYKFVLKDSAGNTVWTMDNFQLGGELGDYAFYPDPAEADQAAASTGGSIQDILTALGTSKKATIVLYHNGAANTTTYTVASNVDWSAYTNVKFEIVLGAVISHGAFTVNIPNLLAGLYQVFSGTGTVTLSGNVRNNYPEWWESTDFGAALQSAINAGPNVVVKAGTHTFTVAHYTPGDVTHPIGVYLKDNTHIVIEENATVTQANGLNLEVFFAGHLWGTDAGVVLDNVTIEVNGIIDGNYTGQSYPASTNSNACPIQLYAKNSNFPIIRAQNYGRYGALVLYYGPRNYIGHIFARNSYDSLYKNATALHLETSVQTNIVSIMAESLQGFAVFLDSGATSLNIDSINAIDSTGAIDMSPGQFMGLNDININSVTSIGNAGVGVSSAGIYIEVYDSPFWPVRDITFGQVSISEAYLDGIQICAVAVTQAAKHIQFGSLLLRNNGQAGSTFGSGLLLRSSDDVKIGSIIAYDDQTPKTQYSGINIGSGVTKFTVGMGDLTGNDVQSVIGYDPTNHHLLDVIGFVTENSGTSAAIASGATIAHGLVATPDYISVTSIDTGLSNVYATVDGTNITVTFTGGGSHAFYWYARTARSN